MKALITIISCIGFLSLSCFANDNQETKGVRYKKAKKIDFESLLIQGEKKRAEIFVVTGDGNDELEGLLRLRENFQDHQTQDFGEELP